MLDWQGFLKLDNAATIDFLSSYAAALSQEGLISERSVDQLKISLASITPQLSSTPSSILSLLSEVDCEFLHIMTARYGSKGFAWNHMRSSTRNILSETCANLATWADASLKKAELFMNRPFVALSHTGSSRQELFPTVLCHSAKILHDAAKDLRDVILELSLMRPADVLDTAGSEYDREYRVAIQVGFSGIESEAISYCRSELRCLRKIIAAFDELATALPVLISGIADNTASNSASKTLEAECEIFAAECQRLAGARFDVSANLNVWETRRLGFLFELYSLNHRMSHLTKLFVESLAPREKPSLASLLTDDFERAVTCNLIQRGTSAPQATKAAKDLMNYCKHHQTTPATLIAAELKKINNDLHEDTLSFAAGLASDELTSTPGGSAEKARFLEAAKRIRKSLNTAVPFSVPLGLMLAGILWGGCGVKTAVTTDAVDPRPKLPFRTDVLKSNQEAKPTPNKSTQDKP